MGVILKCRDLGFKYGKTGILDDINFEVESGLFYAILEKNGSGKTTLLHCLNGILQPDCGSVEIEEQNIATMSRREVPQQVSLIPQEHLDVFPFTVLDVVVMGRAPFLKMTQTPSDNDYRLAIEALKMLASENLADANMAMLYADRVIMIKNGRIVVEGRTEEVMTTANINTLYETRTVEISTLGKKNFFLPESAVAGSN